MIVYLEHAFQPGQQLLGTMIRMEDDRDLVGRSNAPNVVCAGNSTHDGSFLVLVVNTFPAEVGGTPLRHL